MKPLSIAGVVLIALGVLVLIYQGITYTTTETVLDIGPLKATAEERKTVPISPLIGVAGVVGGVVLLIAAGRR